MPTRLISILALALFCSATHAAQKPSPTEFPFELREGMLWVRVQTPKSSTPLNFLLDSGAGLSVLNLNTAKRLNLHLANPIEVQGVGSSSTGYFPQRLAASASGVPLPKQYVAVDLNQLSKACRCDVDGLIGADFFNDRAIQIDFAAQTVRILRAGTPLTGEVLPLKQNRKAFLTPVTVNGHEKQWLRVDTGCASALQWVTSSAPAEQRSSRIAIALTEVPVSTASITVSIGRIAFGSVSADIHEHAIFAGEDGLLGNGILTRFSSVTLDPVAGKIAYVSAAAR